MTPSAHYHASGQENVEVCLLLIRENEFSNCIIVYNVY